MTIVVLVNDFLILFTIEFEKRNIPFEINGKHLASFWKMIFGPNTKWFGQVTFFLLIQDT
jgi:hypothetical protein